MSDKDKAKFQAEQNRKAVIKAKAIAKKPIYRPGKGDKTR